jgi:protein tyrosine/serine phosphatase
LPLARLRASIARAESAFRNGWGRDISTPGGRRMATLHMHLADHAFLRTVWTNLEEFAPGAWRSNQPSPARIARYHAMGIRTILNLRGTPNHSYYLFEVETCRRLGLTLIDFGLAARSLAEPAKLLALLDAFETIPHPFLMHCKSGADRTGLAAALYLLHIKGAPVAQAQDQLHWRYVHLRNAPTGILDHMLDAYAAEHAATGIAIRPWLATRYDRDALSASWAAARGRKG